MHASEDTLSTASLDSAADKDACKGKKPRATKKEVAAKRAAELAGLKGLNLSLLSQGKRKSTAARIEKLEIQIKADELTLSISRSKSLSSGFGTSNATRVQFSDEDVTRLIFARTTLDHEFQQHVNSGSGKWGLMGDDNR
jgi:hypothetical protein